MELYKKYTLITNLCFAEWNGMRLWIEALLISEGGKSMWRNTDECTIRGFGPDSAWPVFTIWRTPKEFPFALKPASSLSAVMLSESGETKPLFIGANLCLLDETVIFLQAHRAGCPIDVEAFTDIQKAWNALDRKTAMYWDQPNMPRLNWTPIQRLSDAFVTEEVKR